MPIQGIYKKKSNLNRYVSGLAAAIFLCFISEATTFAHKVYIFAWQEEDTVHTESYFGSKKKVKDGLIQVFDSSGQKLLEGHTNAQGEFSFKPPQKTNLHIIVEAGMGHKGEFFLDLEEPEAFLTAETESTETRNTEPLSSTPASADAQEIRRIVEEALDSRFKPFMRELARIRKEKEPGFTEIIGGIGYIVGLMGLAMYFRSRKKG